MHPPKKQLNIRVPASLKERLARFLLHRHGEPLPVGAMARFVVQAITEKLNRLGADEVTP